ncbi:unnamed protein product [Strongylus vulgaris]|uniref:Uncharacterized protein n=1 Tax=Strongylus vulgaris TaxID=40348 RepID=A0A3P7IHH3_STRVU|nr:unnamed protein product [Strongylus vulgaris]
MFITMSCASLIPCMLPCDRTHEVINMIIGPLTTVVLVRDVCLLLGGLYKRYRLMEPPLTLQRYFNPEVSSMQINTVLQLSVIAGSLAIPVFHLGELSSQLAYGLCWITAFTTICSGVQYASGQALRKL